jgi:hypothetical protein
VRLDEIWIDPAQLRRTADLAASTAHLPGEAVEIGTWQGNSAVVLANAIAPAILHVVDHWKGCLTIPPEQVARDNYGIFLANMAEATAGNFRVWKMGWRDWVKQWDLPIRFLHLDAEHTVEEVSDNIAALLPFAVPGAVFAGDDYDWLTVREGVHQQFAEVQTAGPLWWKVIAEGDHGI